MEIIFSLDEIKQVAQKIIAENPKKVILFNGNMGVGKTTLIKALATELGVTNATSSPTFSLVNEYQAANNQLVYHFDVYRLKNEIEALDMGIDEYLYSGIKFGIFSGHSIKHQCPEYKYSSMPKSKASLSLFNRYTSK